MSTMLLENNYFRMVSDGKYFNIFMPDELRLPKLPPIKNVYQYMCEAGYDRDTIIRLLIDKYIPIRFVKGGILANRTCVIGLIGARGSGKSCNGSMLTIFDYLIRGVRVWSNMEISITIKYKDCEVTFKTEDIEKLALLNLDRSYQGGMVFLDEINIEFAEARRTMSRRNLAFTNMLQQLRHRTLDLVFTTQNDGWVDDRLRFQTDVFLMCKDAALSPYGREYKAKLGEYSFIDAYDFSGVYRGLVYQNGDLPVWSGQSFMKPFWTTYSTWKMQGMDDESSETIFDIRESAKLAELKRARDLRNEDWAKSIVGQLQAANYREIKDDALWSYLQLDDLSSRTQAGPFLKRAGLEKKRRSQGYVYLVPKIEGT